MVYSGLEIIEETRKRRRRVVLYSELEIIEEHGEHGEELSFTQS